MISKKIKILLAGFAVLMSMNAEAKIEQFQESFAGTLFYSEIEAPTYFKGESTFFNGGVSLTLAHEILDLSPDFYAAFGTFTRNDGTRVFSGIFDFSVTYPDPFNLPDPSLFASPITGSIQYNHSIYSPITGALLTFNEGYGALKGFVDKPDYISFTIDWTILTGDAVSSVPEPQAGFMFGSGLLFLCLTRLKRQTRLSLTHQ